jgi:hypothetical protein
LENRSRSGAAGESGWVSWAVWAASVIFGYPASRAAGGDR